jgi:hypothetical protein
VGEDREIMGSNDTWKYKEHMNHNITYNNKNIDRNVNQNNVYDNHDRNISNWRNSNTYGDSHKNSNISGDSNEGNLHPLSLSLPAPTGLHRYSVYFIVGLFYYIYSFLLFVWLFFFSYALLAVVYVSHVEDRFFNTPCLLFV